MIADAQAASTDGEARVRAGLRCAHGLRRARSAATRAAAQGIGSSASRFTSRSDSADSIDVTPGSTRSVSRRNIP